MVYGIRWIAAWLLSGLMIAPAFGTTTALQCVPYARIVSGVVLRGDAWTWWNQAEGAYKRGQAPRKGAVLAFRPYGPMMLGHVAVVSRVLDDRRVLIRHANWSVPGAIEEDVPAIDVSAAGDWSEVRVWHSPTGQMGARSNPTFGFIYPQKPKLHDFTPDPALGASIRLARYDGQSADLRPADMASERRAAPVARTLAAAVTRESPRRRAPRLEADLRVAAYADAGTVDRSLSAIIADVKREAVLN